MANPITYQLITMIMLLDTSTVNNAENTFPETQTRFDEDSSHSSSSFEECVPPLSEVYFGNDTPFQPRIQCSGKYVDSKDLPTMTSNARRKLSAKERFRSVKMLQDHYMHLLKVHCSCSDRRLSLPPLQAHADGPAWRACSGEAGLLRGELGRSSRVSSRYRTRAAAALPRHPQKTRKQL